MLALLLNPEDTVATALTQRLEIPLKSSWAAKKPAA